MGNTFCDCFFGKSSSTAPVKRDPETSLSESIKVINQLNAGVANLEDNEKTVEAEIDQLVSQIKQECDSRQKNILQQRLCNRKAALRNIKCKKDKAESMAHKKLIQRSRSVCVRYQREASEASAKNEEFAHMMYRKEPNPTP